MLNLLDVLAGKHISASFANALWTTCQTLVINKNRPCYLYPPLTYTRLQKGNMILFTHAHWSNQKLCNEMEQHITVIIYRTCTESCMPMQNVTTAGNNTLLEKYIFQNSSSILVNENIWQFTVAKVRLTGGNKLSLLPGQNSAKIII